MDNNFNQSFQNNGQSQYDPSTGQYTPNNMGATSFETGQMNNYNQFNNLQQPQKKKKPALIIAIIALISILLVACCCGATCFILPAISESEDTTETDEKETNVNTEDTNRDENDKNNKDNDIKNPKDSFENLYWYNESMEIAYYFENGKVTAISYGFISENEYTFDDETITVDGDSVNYTINNNKLQLEIDGVAIIFETITEKEFNKMLEEAEEFDDTWEDEDWEDEDEDDFDEETPNENEEDEDDEYYEDNNDNISTSTFNGTFSLMGHTLELDKTKPQEVANMFGEFYKQDEYFSYVLNPNYYESVMIMEDDYTIWFYFANLTKEAKVLSECTLYKVWIEADGYTNGKALPNNITFNLGNNITNNTTETELVNILGEADYKYTSDEYNLNDYEYYQDYDYQIEIGYNAGGIYCMEYGY